MRSSPAFLAATLFSVSLLSPPAAAESTRTLTAELPADALRLFTVENLAGSMKVTPGSGPGVVAVATVHAESDELAQSMRFENVRGDQGRPTLRVIYPVDQHHTFNYPFDGATGAPVMGAAFGLSSTSVKYDGHKVRVSRGSGVLLYADVEVQVPRGVGQAIFRNVVGPLQGLKVEGDLRFDTDSGNVTLQDVRGTIVADTGSGDVKASHLEGSFSCDTGSGDCTLEGLRGRGADCDTGSGDCDFSAIEGESIACDTGSGNVRVHAATVNRIVAGTGSGNIRLSEVDVEEVKADTGSGNVELDARGKRLARISADTGSGNVRLRLGPDASFEAVADQGSGDLISRYPDARPLIRDKQIYGYRRGDGRIRINVDTGSGDLVLEPGASSQAEATPPALRK